MKISCSEIACYKQLVKISSTMLKNKTTSSSISQYRADNFMSQQKMVYDASTSYQWLLWAVVYDYAWVAFHEGVSILQQSIKISHGNTISLLQWACGSESDRYILIC